MLLPTGPKNAIGAIAVKFLAITPSGDFSISSESKKSYLFKA
jgi:hypothetical protein